MPAAKDAVWLDILPSLRGFGSALSRGVEGPAQDAGKSAGGKLSTGLKVAALAGVAAIGAAIGKGIVDNIEIGKANDKVAAQLGLTAKESGRVGKLAGDLYRDAYGGSLEEVNSAIRGVATNIGDLGSFSNKELEGMGAKALDLASILGEDVDRVTRGVGQLLRNDLAPNAEAAFDIITVAAQRLPESMQGELIDTIEEYGADLSSLGFTGEQAFGALTAAVGAGARNVDLAADGFREFSIRAIDGSKATAEGFQLLGMDADEMAQRIGAGGPTATKATSEIIQAIAGISDPVKQEAAGVALFGTRFEELGVGAIAAMDPLAASLGDVSGATAKAGDTLNDNFGTRMEGWKRQAAGFAQDGLMAVVRGFEDGDVSASGWVGSLQRVGAQARRAFDYFKAEVLPSLREFGGYVVETIVPALVSLGKWIGRNKDFFIPFVATVVSLTAALRIWTAVQLILNAVLLANPFGLVILAVAALVAGLVVAYQRSETFRNIVDGVFKFVAQSGKMMWERFIKPALDAMVRGVVAAWENFQEFKRIVGLVWEGAKEVVSDGVRSVVGKMLDMAEGVLNAADSAFGWIPGLGGKIDTAKEQFARFRDSVNASLNKVDSSAARQQIDFLSGAIRNVPSVQDVTISAIAKYRNIPIGAAAGGPIHGPGTGTSDSILRRLSDGEHVWTAREVQKAGGHAAVEALRKQALKSAAGGHVGCNHAGVPGTGDTGRYAAAMGQGRYNQLLKDREITFTGGGAPLNVAGMAAMWDGIADFNVRTGSGKNPVQVDHRDLITKDTSGLPLGRYTELEDGFAAKVVKNANWDSTAKQLGSLSRAKNAVLVHEMGHAVSLSHSRSSGVMMNPFMNRATLAGEDRSRLRKAYPDRGDVGRVTGEAAKMPALTGFPADYTGLPSEVGRRVQQFYIASQVHALKAAQAVVTPSGSSPNGNKGLGPRAQAAFGAVRDRFGNMPIGGYANRNIAGTNKLSKHALGKAIDVMTYSNTGLGQRVADFFVSNRGTYGVDNVIWNRRINNVGRGGWGAYRGANPHTDHPHIDFYDQGGMLPPGLSTVMNATGKPEAVFNDAQLAALSGRGKGVGMPSVLEVRDVDGALVGRMQVEAAGMLDEFSRGDLYGVRG